MPSPVAHLALSCVAAVAARPGSPLRSPRALGAALAASLLPDADLLGGIAWHHGPTHSLLGAALLGLAAGAALGLRGRALGWAAFAGATHPLLDWELGDPAEAARFGVPLFWPLSAERLISPWPWFLPFHIHREGFVANMVAPEAVGAYLRELVFAAGVLGAAVAAGRLRRGGAPGHGPG